VNDRSRRQGNIDRARTAVFEALCELERGMSWTRARTDLLQALGRDLDRRFAHELAAGTTRRRGALDWILQRHARRPPAELDLEVRVLLRLGLYQMLELDRVGDHSAVHTTVELAKQRAPRAAGFVNAVLRAAQRGRASDVPPARDIDPVMHLAVRFAHPTWLVERWLARFGFEATEQLCTYNDRRPQLVLRANLRRTTREEILKALPSTRPGAWSPTAVRGPSAFRHARKLVRAGSASVQDESAQLVAPLLEPRDGGLYIDVAASPGGKAGHLAELAGPAARIIAIDRTWTKVERVRGNAARLGCGNILAAVADARHLRDVQADGVLVDAPCTGLGVLARRPDLRWRKRREDLERLPRLQLELLEQTAHLVRPGGLLVYSVCSFEPEETVAVVRSFSSHHPELRLEAGATDAALQLEPGLLYWLPHRHGMDGGFAARWRRLE